MFARGFGWFLIFSLLFEPIRNSLYALGNEIGGVGGVGGMTNLWDPTLCNSLAGKEGAYCFHRGVISGLTSFGLAVLLLWTMPFAFAALITGLNWNRVSSNESLVGASGDGAHHDSVRNSQLGQARVVWFRNAWLALSSVWFVVPAVAYLSSPYYQSDIWHRVLALAIAAAFPLSWHLSMIAVPMGSYMVALLGWDRADVVACHKFVGWCTALWATCHGIGELAYLLSQKEGGFVEVMNALKNGENVLYLLGLITFCVLAIHVAIVSVRRHTFVASTFRSVHRYLAALLLLLAAAHWWPFTFFLIPTTAVHGTNLATSDNVPCPRVYALSLSVALPVGVVVVCIVWTFRQRVMEQETADLYTPFVFPPLTLFVSFLASSVAAKATKAWLFCRCRTGA
eukprot:TRINITY_DN76009_c0_g1_i1.p1 TRINITY_DN76009_c0_g1~~TRINITY_DN76009_c0_g1_i1.p1  ORF type:complete len:397 (+),score=26.42 TRINITY_DN76009_c0_g1_i1:54-1244(+)